MTSARLWRTGAPGVLDAERRCCGVPGVARGRAGHGGEGDRPGRMGDGEIAERDVEPKKCRNPRRTLAADRASCTGKPGLRCQRQLEVSCFLPSRNVRFARSLFPTSLRMGDDWFRGRATRPSRRLASGNGSWPLSASAGASRGSRGSPRNAGRLSSRAVRSPDCSPGYAPGRPSRRRRPARTTRKSAAPAPTTTTDTTPIANP